MTGNILWEANDLPGPGQCVSFSPDGKWLAVGIWDHYLVWIRDAETGRPLVELGPESTRGLAVTRTFGELAGGPTLSVQFSPDGRYLATAGDATNGVRIYQLERRETNDPSGGLDATLFKAASGGSSLVFTPDSRSLAFCGVTHSVPTLGLGGHLFCWEYLGTALPRCIASRFSGAVESCSFTPDSRYLLSINKRGEVVTFDKATGARVGSFEAWKPQPGQYVEATEFLSLSPDGSKLALSSRSRLGVEIRDQKTGKVLYSLPDESGTVYWLAWSPNSRNLAISRDNGDVAIWDLETVERILNDLGLNP